ncbi:hypothetical protein Fmac_030876 [Flemingia macrophylla]|uniref:Uncharacterized protein n=1 Tax=Flemingia macrophylla TaxID=520843 RepID=A0ABD1L1Q4_9FABA
MQRTVKKTLQVLGGIGIGGAKLRRGGDDVGAGGFLRRSDGRVVDLAGAASAGAFREASVGDLVAAGIGRKRLPHFGMPPRLWYCAESKDNKTQLIGNFTRNRKRYSNRRDKEERERAKERNQRGGERHRDRLRKPKRRIGRLSRRLASFPAAPSEGTVATGTSSAAAAPPWLRWPCLLEVVDESARFFQQRAEVRVSSGGFGTVSAPKSFASDPDQLKSAREDIKELLVSKFCHPILPDITAPGVSIIAAFSQAAGPSNLESDRRRVLFNLQQGTSMSCPHVAGVAGLIKSYHPDWSPAAIKSAIMTTATTLDNTNQPIKNAFDKVATPFEYGAGHIQPNSSLHPGLVYDLSTRDYLNFLCALDYVQALLKLLGSLNSSYTCPKSFRIEDLNYPSITVLPPVSKPVIVTRTVTNVGPPSTYVVNTHWSKGIKVIVQPSSLTFKKTGEKKKFQVILKTIGVSRREFPSFGSLSWTDGRHRVTSPIVVLEPET